MNASNNILDRISAKTRERISVEMRQVPLSEIRRQAERVVLILVAHPVLEDIL